MTNDFDAQGVFHNFFFYLSVLHVVYFTVSIYRFCVNIFLIITYLQRRKLYCGVELG